MVRIEGWERRLSEYIKESRSTVFQWGVNDCVLFAVKGAEKITGINTYQEYLGYKSKRGADKIIKEAGGFEALITKHYGESHRNIMKARRGDLAMVKVPHLSLGIVSDCGQFVCCISDEGYSRVPLTLAWRIWSYG